MTQHQRQIEYLNVQIQQAALRAQWWIAYSTTEANKSRIVSRGDHRLTPDELVEEALETSKRHIQRMEELADSRDDLIKMELENHG